MIEGARFRGRLLNTCIGAMVFTFLGTLWAAFGLWSLHGSGAPIVGLSLSLCPVLLLVAGISSIRKVSRLPQDVLTREMLERISEIKRKFGLVNTLQGIAIGATFTLGFTLHQPEYVPPVVALIVGIHFFALAPVLQMRLDYVIGALLCLLALGTMLVLPVTISGESPAGNIFLKSIDLFLVESRLPGAPPQRTSSFTPIRCS